MNSPGERQERAAKGKRRAHPRIGVIVPCFNEETYVIQILERVKRALSALGAPEIIVVDDGSTDESYALLYARPDLFSFLIRHRRRVGKGASIASAIRYLSASFVVVQDADTEYFPEDLPALFGPLLEGKADVVYGRRKAVKRVLWRFFGVDPCLFFFSWLVRARTGLAVHDVATCYKAFRSEVLKGLKFRQSGFSWDAEVTVRLSSFPGIRFLEVPVRYNPRTWAEGKKIQPRDAIEFFRTIVTTCNKVRKTRSHEG